MAGGVRGKFNDLLSYPKTSPLPVSADQSRFPLVTLRHFWFYSYPCGMFR